MKIAVAILTVWLTDGTVVETDSFSPPMCEKLAEHFKDGGWWTGGPEGQWQQIKRAECEVKS